ncbi:beta-ketoacyl-ACP synthase II [Aggregatilinea lenta]|uniref:beta-ketoacyl-ACP synthase II n=1 Tax=Aggregatilinea lenta TaxID=913108 RepID=UPI000E5B6584|nr:beta-ketoacyl-ACP synthase II [Aggregatilinea lenta]
MDFTRNGFPRVVITGIGAITPLGRFPDFWEALKRGESGIRRIQSFDPSALEVQIAAEVLDFDPTQFLDAKEARRMGRPAQFAVAAVQDAMADAGFSPADLEPIRDRVGVDFGSSMGGHDLAQQASFGYRTRGRRPGPFSLIQSLPNIPAHYVSRVTGALGPLVCISTACATGTHSIGDGFNLVRYGRADVVFTGGVEAMILDYAIAGFISMTALATGYNDNPAASSRPFDLNRTGFVFGEGGGILVLETMERAVKRGARIYAEVLGMASSSDAYHVAALDPDGSGAARAMTSALSDAKVNARDIDYINAHGTSTKANDSVETKAIKDVFGEHAYDLSVSSTKSMVGHLLGGAGAIEAIATVMTLYEKVMHPTINYETPDPECDLDYVPNVARERDVRYALSNSFGLGGQNACIVLGAV